MEVTRDDTSQSLSMALKQKDSKIGLLTQNLQQQEGENMAMEAKLVFRSMKRERENKLDPWGNRRKSPRESIPYPSGNRSGAFCPTILALWALYLSLFHHRMQNSPSFFIIHRSYNFVLILSTNNAPSKLSTWDVFFLGWRVILTAAGLVHSVECSTAEREVAGWTNRELKQQRFWATHVNRKWPFLIFWRWFRANFQSNRLYNSKEAKEYKFYIIKAC